MSNSKIKIIIIDDDSGIIDSIKGFIGDKYDIEGFTSSKVGLNRLKEETFDLLILDYYIDELNGHKVIDEIRKYNDDLYILLLTGFGERLPGIECLETLKIQNYYEKSGDFERLIIFIEGIIKSMDFFKSEKMTIGKRIKELRKQHGLSQEEVAKYLEVQRTTISLYESGDATPQVMTIIKLARLFNVTTDYILCYELNIDKRKIPIK